jgi:ligand-binding sensor domain-containing protein/signal transduction histidine kinase
MRLRLHFFSLIFSLLLVNSSTLFSQDIHFNKVSVTDEAENGLITSIKQDQQGNIWFGMNGNGLIQYDGVRRKSYQSDPLNAGSLSNNYVECIYIGRDGMIWVGTFGSGLDRLDPKTGVFTHYRHNDKDPNSLLGDSVTCILEDRDGFIWAGTSWFGLNRLDPKTGKFAHYLHQVNDPKSLTAGPVRVVYEDKQGVLWIGTGSPFFSDQKGKVGGLNRYNKSRGNFTTYIHDDRDQRSLIDNRVRAICEDSHGNFWVGTAGDGLHKMDRTNGSFERLTYDPAHPEKLSRPPSVKKYNFGDDHITFITEDIQGGLWIGTLEAGLTRYDPVSRKISHYTNQKENEGNFSDSTTWTECTTRDGIMWVSTFPGTGLYRFDPAHQNIHLEKVLTKRGVATYLDESDQIQWLGTDSGLIYIDKKNNETRLFLHDDKKPGTLSSHNIQVLYKDRRGRIWVGTTNGLNLFNRDKQTFTTYKHERGNSNSLANDFILSLFEDHASNLWVGTLNGLDRLNAHENGFTHYKANPEDTATNGKNTISSIIEDNRDNLWIANYNAGGLFILNRETGQFKNYLNIRSIVSLHEDGYGKLWAGTEDGLYIYNNETDSFSVFIDPSTTNSIVTHAIAEDNNKNLWVISPAGICRISSNRYEVSRFGKGFGINAQFLFYLGAFKAYDGKMIFGNILGYYIVNPEKISNNATRPEIVLTEFRISDQPVKTGPGSPLKESHLEAKQIVLAHNQDVFTFFFNIIHYSNPEANRAMYKLENYDLGWRPAGSDHTAYYYNVPPGKYIFRIKAVSSEGVWAEKTIDVIITPPWWMKWWAYCIYGLLAAALIYFLYRLQKQRVIKAERERTRARELAQAKEIEKAYNELKITQGQLIQSEKMASLGEMTAGIAHEIQNPLNFMNNFSEVNAELIDEMKEELKAGNHKDAMAIADNIADNERKINSHGRRADAIVKSMLQHSRTGSGKKEPTSINALADEYLRLAYHGLRAKDPSFNATMKTDFDPGIGSVPVIAQDIGRVFLNLYNNAFYAVNEKKKSAGVGYEPTLWVSTRMMNGQIEIIVKDNGNGIPQKVKNKIYQPFFTTKPPGQGTGLGLSLSYDIAKAHGGEIKMETKEGEGTTFTIQLSA